MFQQMTRQATDKLNSDAHLLIQFDELLRTRPAWETIHNATEENLSWIGRAAALIEKWNSARMVQFNLSVQNINSQMAASVDLGYRALVTLLYQAREDLRINTIGPLNTSIAQGSVFDYFDAIRKLIELASDEILFVDPYLDPDFVARYLPHLRPEVTIRLLTSDNKLKTLLPSVEMFDKQRGSFTQVRSIGSIHDRYFFVDKKKCYHSGASFKDGAKQAPTTLTEITDAFSAVWNTYERFWAEARIERPTPPSPADQAAAAINASRIMPGFRITT